MGFFLSAAINLSVIAQTSPVEASCLTPIQLAQSKGWTPQRWVDLRYGGLQVSVSRASLPSGWEGIGPGGQKISSSSSSRSLSGVWTIYAPIKCRVFSPKLPWTTNTAPRIPTNAISQTSSLTESCTDHRNPVDLALTKGWKLERWIGNFGGLVVTLFHGSDLPKGWSADGGQNNRHIGESDTWRGMESGSWSLYPPYACQSQVVQKPLNGQPQQPSNSCSCPVTNTNSTPDCTLNPLDLAITMKWKPLSWETDRKYNGLEIWLNYGSQLPALWEAQGGEKNRTIHANDAWRAMEGGKWTIYGPNSCQAGYVQKTIPAAPSEIPNCMSGKDLAAQRGWTLAPDQGDTATYGGAVVKKSLGGLPDAWKESCSTDGTTCSIYPPEGACRVKLGVK